MTTKAEYRRRRQRLMGLMGQGSLAVVPGAAIRVRNGGTEYPFRQDSDFYYLTGFTEPNALLVLAPGRQHGEAILFCEERDAAYEQWHGERLGPERAASVLGVDDAFPAGDIADIVPGLLEGTARIYSSLGQHAEFDRNLLAWVQRIGASTANGAEPPGEFVALNHVLHDLRLYKSAAELALMRRAAEITAAAHRRAMTAARPGLTETDLEAELVHEFMCSGARFPAYPSIVGAGRNACVLHYTRNDAVLRDGDLVLIDAGCEYRHYAADVTRTFPVNGRFSAPQQALYEIVLDAQQRAIAAARRGVDFDTPHTVAVRAMVDGLRELGLLAGEASELIETGAYRRFCPHRSSHWLGLDVHDVGDYKIAGAWRQLEPGMVLTVEPGLYVPEAADVPARYRGIGIRIEDDVVITRAGNDVLTAAAPKRVAEIESLMKRRAAPRKPSPRNARTAATGRRGGAASDEAARAAGKARTRPAGRRHHGTAR